MATGDPIRIVGLREIRSELRRVDTEAPKAMKTGLAAIAAKVVAKVQSKVPHKTGRMAGSDKPRATATGASIAFGGRAAPWAPFIEFGGSTGPGHQPRKPGSGAIKREWLGRPNGDGRYLYPTISEEKDNTIKEIDELIADVIRRHGFETRGGN